MIPFLKLPATSRADRITIKEVFRNDIWRLLLSIAVLLGVFYGAGMLIADVANNKYPVRYYTQLVFGYMPALRLIVPLGFCVLVMGTKRDERWWSCLIVSELIFVINMSNQTHRFDFSGMLSLGCVVLLIICAWRLWDYYELRRIYHYDTPYLTRPALGLYIGLAVVSLIMLLPSAWIPWFW